MSMENLRPECGRAHKNDRKILGLEALKALLKSVSKRRGLIRGKLDKGNRHCALGCFFADHPGVAIETRIAEMVASLNDSLSDRAKPQTRLKRVQHWLREQIAILESQSKIERKSK